MSGNRPEQAATVTPGQAAYEAYAMAAPDEIDFTEPGDLPDWERGAWEAAAKAAVPGYRMLVDEALAERDRLTERVAELVTEGNELRRERDKAYRERAALVAYLSAVYPSVLKAAPDAEDWLIAYVATPSGQMSWHIAPEDTDLFRHLPPTADCAPWDGHTTEEKYERLAELTRTVATGIYGPQPHRAPAVVTAGTEHLGGQLPAIPDEDGRP